MARVAIEIWNSTAMAKAANEDRTMAISCIKNFFSNACVLGYTLQDCIAPLIANIDETQVLIGSSQFADIEVAINATDAKLLGSKRLQAGAATPKWDLADRSIPVVLVTTGNGKKLVVICFRDMEFKHLKMYPVLSFFCMCL